MNISRRWFIGGLASYGAFGGSRLLSAAGHTPVGRPNLTFGVVSDVHLRLAASGDGFALDYDDTTFVHTLEWFRDQKVDAVIIAGDIADTGLIRELEYAASAWRKVFPNDKAPDGRTVTRLFVYGNHDAEGAAYTHLARNLWPDEAERAAQTLRSDLKGHWERIFEEEFSPVYQKIVKGYSFVGAHWTGGWCRMENETGIVGVEEFFQNNKGLFDPKKPFFYFQHPHPKNTCYAHWACGHDDGRATRALTPFPNAIAFSGHSHTSLTHEHSIWQGAFTSVGTGSLRYTGGAYARLQLPVGYENFTELKLPDTPYKMTPGYGSTRDARQGLLVRVYDSHVRFTRREFVYDQFLGDDWVLPLETAEPKPFAFVEHARRSIAPEFPPLARLIVSTGYERNHGRPAKNGLPAVPALYKKAFYLDFPAATGRKGARAFDYEVVAASRDGKTKIKRYLLAQGYNLGPANPRTQRPNTMILAADRLPQGVEFRFAVRPRNSLGKPGRPIASAWIKPV